ncbi:class I SAM-dependent methyltransferase [Flexivirga caeni]|uniref:Class I SAM-dependent methyltransferase n=1 Tax=Flexivirga caeni TaxID=2294115 RepID=A0A3M9LXD9_9MICO|nr:class I SAM-dependent methyltransferase [Flexivirga caeni]RNI17253.1 class I SAM-dependent methyltransferase [Flexivirga caeni]
MLKDAVRVATDYVAVMMADPGQARYTRAWLHSRKRSTLDLRVPWVPFRVIAAMEEHISKRSKVAEFGGGGSTLWFSDRVEEVVTVEHDLEWYPVLEQKVRDIPNSTLLYRSADSGYADYVNALSNFSDSYFDVIVVDGRERVRCFESAIPKLKPGGLLILDNSDRPRYASVFDLTEWSYVTYCGLTPTQTLLGQSTIWTKSPVVA